MPPVPQQWVELMHPCGCVIGRLCVDASDLVYIAHFVCRLRYLCLAYTLCPIQPLEGTQIMSVQTGHEACKCSGAMCDGVMW